MENLTAKPFTIDFFLKHPPFFNTVIQRCQEVGMSQAGLETLQNTNIRVVIEGSSEALKTPGHPALLVADHMSGVDDSLLVATLPLLGREDVVLTVKPYTYSNHLAEMFRRPAEERSIPFVPSYMAKDKKASMPYEDKIMKYLLRKKLLTEEEIKKLNYESLKKAASLISEGKAVNVYPEGYSAKGVLPWKKGVGEVIKLIPDYIFDQVVIVPYRFRQIYQKRMQTALIFPNIARLFPSQIITLRLGQEATLQELFPGGNIQSLSASEITWVLQNWYRKQY